MANWRIVKLHLMLRPQISIPLNRDVEVYEQTLSRDLEALCTAFRTKLRIDSRVTGEALEKEDTSTCIGEGLVDATTLSERMCSYDRTFCLLYEINWARVIEYAGDKETLSLFDAHATALTKAPGLASECLCCFYCRA
ncbi:hypothetical protein GJ744_007180 [Endocarpon pusillum]|uniref:Uncharacterized protein n=1 Tax=Endocarpon pusillum TaxID=364733 RepID=A0A8H7AN13_9EURO|nr:hypothetical protein GJ744_007180 [Endocarpon pusillum]